MRELMFNRPDISYVEHSEIEVNNISADSCSARVVIREIHLQPYGVVHGGLYCTAAETVASEAGAAWAVEQGMAGAMGVSNKTDFLKATTDGVLIVEAMPIHRGRTQQLWQVNITREHDGRLVAQSQIRLHNVMKTDF
jgi:1,4-dihydroxy-2-naphthoyl-CoA hydrolase